MTLTRDQLRAARMLLRLQQNQLAELAKVGIATIKRFETGSDIRAPQAEALRVALDAAGAVLLDGSAPSNVPTGIGVALKPTADLPKSTLARIAAEEAREAKRIEADRVRREAKRIEVERLRRKAKETAPSRPLGRPKKAD